MKKTKLSHAQVMILLVVIALFLIAFVISMQKLVEKEEKPMYTFEEALQMQLDNGTEDLRFDTNGYLVPASDQDIKSAMDIGTQNIYAFIRLDKMTNIDADKANRLLEGKGILENTGEYFVEAEQEFKVNAVYLIAHAMIETGNGKSELAKGIEVEDKKYYNFFGIGAFDHAAVKEGSSFAKKGDWSSVQKAIKGGAKFIRENYMDNGQNTLYKMRWNPEAPGTHLYATDIHWADSIARNMESFYKTLELEPAKIEKEMYKK